MEIDGWLELRLQVISLYSRIHCEVHVVLTQVRELTSPLVMTHEAPSRVLQGYMITGTQGNRMELGQQGSRLGSRAQGVGLTAIFTLPHSAPAS